MLAVVGIEAGGRALDRDGVAHHPDLHGDIDALARIHVDGNIGSGLGEPRGFHLERVTADFHVEKVVFAV